MAVEFGLEARKRAEIEITPATSGERLGFQIRAKRKTLNHPQILFYGGWTRLEWGGADLHPCDLYDENGNSYKDDFILVGRPVRIFPLIAEKEFYDSGDTFSVSVKVIDLATKREVITNTLSEIPKVSNIVLGPKDEPKPSSETQISIQVIADGLNREEIQRFHLALETMVSMLGPKHRLDEAIVHNTLLIKREPWIWRRI